MNNFDLQKELEKNETDRQLSIAELEINRKKWVEYITKNQDEICLNPRPLIVRKKISAKWNDFINRVKLLFGLKKKKERDGIETYLQYCNSIE